MCPEPIRTEGITVAVTLAISDKDHGAHCAIVFHGAETQAWRESEGFSKASDQQGMVYALVMEKTGGQTSPTKQSD